MNYGAPVPEAECISIMKNAISIGVNFFDIADGYAQGKTEEILGKALKSSRQSVLIATKTGVSTGLGINDSGLSRAHTMYTIFLEY